ncbi:MAG TPA: vWA domain-containing protein, partial [Polyangium sp.]|nr:vWA domain-containing protein [Polyangium sp.]
LDRSGSMYGTNWLGATAALKLFVQDPASDGINVGILYFPIDTPPDGVVCNAAHYQNLTVPIGPLPQNALNLVQSIDSQAPTGGSTPMYGALDGTLWAATQAQIAQPNHKVVVVFASDGDPNTCTVPQNDIAEIADLIQSSFLASAIETYVIAIAGASITNLDQLAAAGGTGKAYDVTGNINQFSQKMADIRTSALSCEYIIPPPPADEPFELDLVVVKYVAADGTQTEIVRADNEIDCGQAPGWYFDDPVDPKKIRLCPASCDVARLDKQARVDVFFGCKPKLN